MRPARPANDFGAWVIIPSVIATFALVPLCLLFGWPVNLIGWCFTSYGLSLIVSRTFAYTAWSHQLASVIEVEDYDGGQAIKVRYNFNGEVFTAKVSGYLSKRVGETVLLLVNPKDPSRFMALGVPLMILAALFVLLGTFFGLSISKQTYNWN
jgi:hypothetical protein